MRGSLRIVGFSALVAGAVLSCQRQTSEPSATERSHPTGAHRVVIEVNVDGAERWEGILNNVENLQKSLGASGANTVSIEIVAHAKGLGLLLATNDALRARMQAEHDGGVVFAACENTMKKQNVIKDQLMPFAITVDSGVAEVVRKQETGWSYIKGGG
jgi:intracellular sulfur oxidation DsrE/DsrF family protein